MISLIKYRTNIKPLIEEINFTFANIELPEKQGKQYDHLTWMGKYINDL